jgi:hypothetical protein
MVRGGKMGNAKTSWHITTILKTAATAWFHAKLFF